MSKFSEPAVGKCATCGDQLLSIPGRTPEQPRRIICPICSENEREVLYGLIHGTTTGLRLWRLHQSYKSAPTAT